MEPQTLEAIGRIFGAGIAVGLGGIGAGIGMGMVAASGDEGLMRQPTQNNAMVRTMLIGQAVGGGTVSVFPLVIAILILFMPATDPEMVGGNFVATMIGAGLAIGLGSFGSGLGCGWPGATACDGVARNPRKITPITLRMVIGQAVAQSPTIFAMVIALLLLFTQQPGTDVVHIGIVLGAGLAIGAGALGPGIGSGIAAGGGITGIGKWPQNQDVTFRNMLVAQAVCQTPAIFGLLVAFVLFTRHAMEPGWTSLAQLLAAGIAAGFGGIGAGIGSGFAGETACEAIAARVRSENVILRTMLTGQAVSQTTAVYALVIALVVLYIV